MDKLKTGGRQKGVPNKITTEIKEMFKEIVEGNLSKLESDLHELTPKERIDAIIKLSEFIVPKLQRSSIDFDKENKPTEIVIIRGNKFADKNNEIEND
jgi:hypothetical protein